MGLTATSHKISVLLSFSIAAACSNSTATAASPAPALRAQAKSELQTIYKLAHSSKEISKSYLQEVFNAPLSESCLEPVVEGVKFRICTFDLPKQENSVIDLEFAKTSRHVATNSGATDFSWRIENNKVCINKRDVIEIFQVQPTPTRKHGTRDLIGGINTLPHFNDYELVLLNPEKNSNAEKQTYLYVNENNRCVRGISLHKPFN